MVYPRELPATAEGVRYSSRSVLTSDSSARRAGSPSFSSHIFSTISIVRLACSSGIFAEKRRATQLGQTVRAPLVASRTASGLMCCSKILTFSSAASLA